MINKLISILTILIFLISGCKTTSDQVRKSHVNSFEKSLNEKKIDPEIKYTLDECLNHALTNNLKIKAKEIEKTISSLDRKSSFSYLLPRVELNFQTQNWSKEPLMKMNSSGHTMYVATHDDSYVSSALNIGLPLLTPSAWFLYSMRKKGEDISHLNLILTKQMISMRITALYYSILAFERHKENLNARITSASVLCAQINQFYLEGLISECERTEQEVYLLSCKNELTKTGNKIIELKSELLLEMGFSPLDDITLDKNYIFKPQQFELEELIFDALLNHPALFMQDKIIDIQRDRVKFSLTNFLPNIIGYANLNNTGNSFEKYSTYWISGIQGIWSVFNGFQNINDYKIAKANKRLEFTKREEACLSIMLSITKAYLAYQNSIQDLKIADSYLKSSNLKLKQIEAKWQEGIESYSNYNKIIADNDYALFLKNKAELMQQVSIANLYNVIGKTYMGKENAPRE